MNDALFSLAINSLINCKSRLEYMNTLGDGKYTHKINNYRMRIDWMIKMVNREKCMNSIEKSQDFVEECNRLIVKVQMEKVGAISSLGQLE